MLEAFCGDLWSVKEMQDLNGNLVKQVRYLAGIQHLPYMGSNTICLRKASDSHCTLSDTLTF